MKIVATSNYNLENFNETVVAENVEEMMADVIAGCLNDKLPKESSVYYQPKPDDYQPFKFQP